MLPATKNMPKEMLPVLDKPAIQYVVEECIASGIREILIITGRHKRAIEDHFDRSFELEATLEAKGDRGRLEEVRRIAEMADIHYVRQKETRGLGHAVSCARAFIGNEPFALLLGDDIIESSVPATKQLLDTYRKHGHSVVAVENIPPERIEAYGVITPGAQIEPDVWGVEDLVEKPRRSEAPSSLGIMGRYVLTPAVFTALEATPSGKSGEIQLTDALRKVVGQERILARAVEGRRYDVGTLPAWLKTNLELALRRPDLQVEMRAAIEATLKRT